MGKRAAPIGQSTKAEQEADAEPQVLMAPAHKARPYEAALVSSASVSLSCRI